MSSIKTLLTPAPLRPDYADAGDFLRVASVGMIGWYHIWQQSWLNPDLHLGDLYFRFYPIVACGYMFVDLMLLLSGFLLMLGYLSGRGRDLRSFYSARAARILPSYLLCMAIMLFAFALPGRLYGSSKHLWTDVLSHLSFTHNLFRQSYSFTHLNGALWTLAVEVQFYLIFPFLARAFEKKPALTYAAMLLAGLGARLAIGLFADEPSFYMNRLSAMLDVYANGMLAAWVFVRLSRKPQRAWQAWLSTLLALVSLWLIYRIIDSQFSLRGGDKTALGQLAHRLPLTLSGCMLLICGSRSIGLVRRLFSNRPVRFLSSLSFNFYIWHQFLAVKLKAWRIPAYTGDTPNMDGQQPWQSRYTLCCFAFALLLSLVITYLIEKPCARWIKGRLSRKPT